MRSVGGASAIFKSTHSALNRVSVIAILKEIDSQSGLTVQDSKKQIPKEFGPTSDVTV